MIVSAQEPVGVRIGFGAHEIELSPTRMIWIPALRLLCAADVHFEKSSFFSRFATFLPPYDTAENLARLRLAIEFYRPKIFIALGDSFHDVAAGDRLSPTHLDDLNAIVAQVEIWHWLSGNHDPAMTDKIDGLRSDELEIAGLTFRHQSAGLQANHEISGHFHPKLRLTRRGHSMSGACFARHGHRLILPAFGQYTGGLDVDSREFLAIMPEQDRRLYLLHSDRVFAV